MQITFRILIVFLVSTAATVADCAPKVEDVNPRNRPQERLQKVPARYYLWYGIECDFKIGGKNHKDRIFIGKDDAHPSQIPFVLAGRPKASGD